jgi:hypothetical protein
LNIASSAIRISTTRKGTMVKMAPCQGVLGDYPDGNSTGALRYWPRV